MNKDFPNCFEASLCNYFQYLVNHFYKILPMKEQGEESVCVYLESLKFEILGFDGLFTKTNYSSSIITLLSILQRLIDDKDCGLPVVRREVFRAISICNRLKDMYSE